MRSRSALLLATLAIILAALPTHWNTIARARTESPDNQIVVTASAQWVNTMVVLTKGEHVTIHASGSWTPGEDYPMVGPAGYPTNQRKSTDNFLNLRDIGVCAYCASTPAPHWAALIGYIGGSPPAPGSYTSSSVLPEARKVFYVGAHFNAPAPRTGLLWLNFNDDAYSDNTGDNAGQVTATIATASPTPAPLMSNQQRLAKAVASYKNEVDTAFQALDGVATQFGDEGQYFRDEVIRDQAGAAFTIADSAIGVASASATALSGAAQLAYQNALKAFTLDLTKHALKESSKELLSAALKDYLAKTTMQDQASTLVQALGKRKAAIDGSLDALAASVPKLSAGATSALIATMKERQQALAWVVTKLARGGAAALHGAYLQKHSGQFLTALITAILQVGAPVLATVLFGPAGTVAAKVAVGAWSVAMAKEQLTTDGQVAALYELALIGVESYAGTIKREARSVAALVVATPLPPSPQGSMTDLTGLELGIEHQATQTFDVKRAVVRVTVYNPGATPVTYRVIATYSTTFDVPFGSTPPIPTTLDGFRRSSDQTLPRSDMMTALTVQPGQQASIDLALTDAGANLVLEPAAGTIIKIGLVATTADATKTPGSMLLQTAKVAYDGQSVSHHVVLASL